MAGTSGNTRTTLPTVLVKGLDFSQGERGFEVVDFVELLPGEPIFARASEMTIRRGLAVDRAAQVEVAQDRGRPKVEDLFHRIFDLFGIDGPVPNVSTMIDTGCATPMA